MYVVPLFLVIIIFSLKKTKMDTLTHCLCLNFAADELLPEILAEIEANDVCPFNERFNEGLPIRQGLFVPSIFFDFM